MRGSSGSKESLRMGSSRPVSQDSTERVTTSPPLLLMTSFSTTVCVSEEVRGRKGVD